MPEPTLSQQLLQIIIPVAVAAVSALTTWALYELKKWIKSRTDSQALDDAMLILEDVVHSTVARVGEVVKQAGEDGIITASEAERLKSVAINSINNQIPVATKKILEAGNKDLQDFISGKIEIAVLSNRRQKASVKQ